MFREGSIYVQRLKNFFVYNLWSWNILYLGGEAITLLGFFGVVGFQLRAGLFFGFPGSFCVVGLPGISHVYRFRFLVISALAYLSKKKKKS